MQWMMLQQDEPEDFVIATGVQYSVRTVRWSAAELGITLRFEGPGGGACSDRAHCGRSSPGAGGGDVIVRVDPRFRPTEVETCWATGQGQRSGSAGCRRLRGSRCAPRWCAEDLKVAQRHAFPEAARTRCANGDRGLSMSPHDTGQRRLSRAAAAWWGRPSCGVSGTGYCDIDRWARCARSVGPGGCMPFRRPQDRSGPIWRRRRWGHTYANNTFRPEFIFRNLAIEANIIHAAHINDVQSCCFWARRIYPNMRKQPMREDTYSLASSSRQ